MTLRALSGALTIYRDRPSPARPWTGVAALADPGFLIDIEVTAVAEYLAVGRPMGLSFQGKIWGSRLLKQSAVRAIAGGGDMRGRCLALCGMIAPLLFISTAILGAALRPGYSHIADTVSELFSPGSPNKPLLDTLHTLYALLLTLFGVGLLDFVRRSGRSNWTGEIGAVLWILAGLVSVIIATVFPQDPWGSPATFPGQMHIALTGVVGLLSLLGMVGLASWFHRTGWFPGFRTYTWITIGAVIGFTVIFSASVGGPWMGLTERILGLIGFQWTFTLALWLFRYEDRGRWKNPPRGKSN